MNKAITDGVLLMPPAFADGLDVWSSGNGTPGSDTYLNAANAAFVVADQDFGGCLELQKVSSTTRVHYMGQTQLAPGCYLRITARVKAISGNFPAVRISGYAARADGSQVTEVPISTGAQVLSSYGDVVEVSAIVGAGKRNGVDLVWGPETVYGHFGISLTGANGGIVRIDDIEIEDITSVFLRDIVSTVDVRDFGAVGDGVTDDSDAFDAANAAADGRTILVPSGTFRLEKDVALDHIAKFEGTLSMPVDKMLLFGRVKRQIDQFEQVFWSGQSLEQLYQTLSMQQQKGMAALFVAAMGEWKRSFERNARYPIGLQTRIDKQLDVAMAKEMEGLEKRLLFLASLGSAAPFVGLFGTVVGIMTSFQAIAGSKSTNLAVVAPGIAEALLATALGLLAAIPAVLAYNKLSADAGKIGTRLEGFADEFSAILSRQVDEKSAA